MILISRVREPMWGFCPIAECVYSIYTFRNKKENFREGPEPSVRWIYAKMSFNHLITGTSHFDKWVTVALGHPVTSVNSEPIQGLVNPGKSEDFHTPAPQPVHSEPSKWPKTPLGRLGGVFTDDGCSWVVYSRVCVHQGWCPQGGQPPLNPGAQALQAGLCLHT